MEFNEFEIIDHAEDQSLTKFLSSSSNLSSLVRPLQKQYEHVFHATNYFSGEKYVQDELISPLECAAMCGTLSHVRVLLNPSRLNVISLLKGNKGNLVHVKQAAFFRALENSNIEIANFLLDDPEVMEAAETLTIGEAASDNLLHENYLKKFISRYRHLYMMNSIPDQGNIALLLAAQSGNLEIFNRLLSNVTISKQLPKIAIIAFLSITRTYEGLNVDLKLINMSIIKKLLDIPKIHAYVCSREFDFGEILKIYKANGQNSSYVNTLRLKVITESNSPSKETIARSHSSRLFGSPITTVDDYETLRRNDSINRDDDLGALTPLVI
jgi:hypothetical protein